MRPIVDSLILVVLVQLAAASIVAGRSSGSCRGQQRGAHTSLNCTGEGLCGYYAACCCRLNKDKVPQCYEQVGDTIEVRCSNSFPRIGGDILCASNGETYSREWDLAHASCTLNKPLAIKHFGKCREKDMTSRPGWDCTDDEQVDDDWLDRRAF